MKKIILSAFFTAALLGFNTGHTAYNDMSFFITSAGLGNGADLGGLTGADAHCSSLATAVGAGDKNWKAYLSTEAEDKRGVSARDRIGNGPWHNAKGELVGENLTDLHLYNRKITLQIALWQSLR
ncbi:MAG: hypothetical protein ACI9J2_001621 [Saprospiraceae bacterium]|jgi:hypothetical protein